jgi:hypothetical protein
MDEQKPRAVREKEPQLKRPEEAVKDLEPQAEESDAIKGGFTKYFDKASTNP